MLQVFKYINYYATSRNFDENHDKLEILKKKNIY